MSFTDSQPDSITVVKNPPISPGNILSTQKDHYIL